MEKSKIWVFVSVLCAMFVLVACAPGSGGSPTPTPLPPVSSYEKSIFTVEEGPIVEEKQLMGEIVPSRQEELFFRASGFVTRVSVKQGDVVKKGTVLAEMQVDDLLNQLQQARIDLEVAQANLAKDKAQREYDIQKATAEVTIWKMRVADAQLDYDRAVGIQKEKALLNLNIAKENLALAEAALKLVQENTNPYMEQAVKRSQLAVERLEGLLAERQIVAPFDCVVLRAIIRPGQQVDAFFVVFVVGDPSELIVRSPYDFDLASKMTDKIEVNLYFDSKDEKGYTVSYLPNFLPVTTNKEATTTRSSGDYFYFSLPKEIQQQDLKVGRTVFLKVILGRKEKALLLPPSAIREYKGLRFVIVQDGEKRRRVEVNEIGLKGTDKWEIVADLKPGDKVVGP
ncbi:MAG TPA: hypothetical protein DEQ80_07030 [Anaerolinea thermolimosa]|uniref:CzcB-like barrel-sandwich hybrid domain-containing protein n=1 Tax=Anaerolinea thermolimosa TaxID=229919 RepID=A0A3D1JIZ0_9CHLR|nr:hypothetical protein [Anaerolinea thermolimosa]